MISKNEFVEILERLKEANDLQNKVNELFRDARDNVENDFCNGASLMISHESIVIQLLEDMFNDRFEYPNISWWIYETDYGRNKEMNKIYNSDGKTIYKSLDSAEDLYDYLIECMEEKNAKNNR